MKKLMSIIATLSLVMCLSAVPAFATDPLVEIGNNSAGAAAYTYNDNRTFGAEQKDLTSINNRGSGYRGFANQAEISYGPLPGYLGPARHDANVQSAKIITMYKNTFTRADVEALVKGVNIDANRYVDKVAEEDEGTVTVIFIAPDKSEVVQCAVITTKATSKETASANVLGAAILSALEVGADILLVTAEGLSTELASFGWGVGFAYSSATISTDEKSGGIGSGGLGISGGSAGPYLNHSGADNDLNVQLPT